MTVSIDAPSFSLRRIGCKRASYLGFLRSGFEKWICDELDESAIMLTVRPIEPFESLIKVSTRRENFDNLIG